MLQYWLPTTFCNAYGDSGLVGMSSRLGNSGVLPYSDEDPAKTSRLTPASRAATSTFSAATTFALLEVIGICRTERVHRWDRRLVQHVVDTGNRARREREIGQVALEKLDARKVRQVGPLAGDQAVGHADAMPAALQFFREVRSDETCAAGHKV